MPESEPRCVIPRPQNIITPQEAEVFQKAGRGELPCPCCSHPLWAEKGVSEVYEGLVLYCPDQGRQGCDYREY